MNLKIILYILFLFWFYSPVIAQQNKQPVTATHQTLENYIESLKKDEDLQYASWGVKVVNCNTKKTEAEYNASVNHIPASIVKVFTTGIGAITFGNNYRFNTILAHDGYINADSVLYGNIYLIGGGDPSFGSDQFKNTVPESIFSHFLQAINKIGVRTVNGKLIADISLFDHKDIHDTWEWGDIGNYYGTGTSALSFNENSFNISIYPGAAVSDEGTIGKPFPALEGADIKNQTITTGKNSVADALIFSSPMGNEYWVSGTIPTNRDSVVAKGAIQNPAMVCLKSLDNYLNNNGIFTQHQFEIKTDTAKLELTDTIAVWQSPTFHEIADITNRYSNNMYAESILKLLATNYKKTGQASYEKGIKFIMGQVKSKGIETKNIRLMDGSGLSRQNLISPDFMCQFLLMMHDTLPDFDQLLPSPGERGTLVNFMHNNKTNRNKVRMKSGSMTGVLNYAGYITNKKGEKLCVTVMTNNFSCKVSKIRPKIDKLINLIAESD